MTYFLLLALGVPCSSFSSLLRWKVKPLIFRFSFFSAGIRSYTIPSKHCISWILEGLVCCVFIFIYLKVFPNFPCDFFFFFPSLVISSLTPWLRKNVLFTFHIFVDLLNFLLLLLSSLNPLLSENIYDFCLFKLNEAFLWPNVRAFLENASCVLGKITYFDPVGRTVL